MSMQSDSEEEDMSNYGVSMVSIAGPSAHDCGYCKGTDSSISFGIWAHAMTCPVRTEFTCHLPCSHFIFL